MRLTYKAIFLGSAIFACSPAYGDFIPLSQPTAAYISSTNLADFTDPDYTSVSSLMTSGLTLSYSSALEERTVPVSWNVWNTPPAVESSTPRVGFTNGASSLTISLSQSVDIFGLEIEPNSFSVEETTAAFYSGNSLIGTLDLFPDGNGGALLFAASTSTDPFTSIVITNVDGDDFAIARQRFSASAISPEPQSLSLVGAALVIGLAFKAKLFRRS